jgi:hypothetical protein
MRGAALAALCVIALAASASAAPAPGARTHAAGFPLVAIHFEFKSDEFATHYTVVNTLDRNGLLDLANATYSWSLKPPDNDTTCNNHGVLSGTGKDFVWKHGNVGENGHDDGCHHDIGLPDSGHQGTVSVEVKDPKWSCVASYTGTQAADGSAIGDGPAGNCDALNAAPQPPPPPAKCKCVLLTARVVPSSLKLTSDVDGGHRSFSFTVHWILNCAKGDGGCNGHLSVQEPPTGKEFRFFWLHNNVPRDPEVVGIACRGRCSESRDGGKKLELYGDALPGTGQAKGWKNARVRFLIKRACQKKKLKPITIVIAFDATGKKLDLKRSKLS